MFNNNDGEEWKDGEDKYDNRYDGLIRGMFGMDMGGIPTFVKTTYNPPIQQTHPHSSLRTTTTIYDIIDNNGIPEEYL